MNAAPASTLLTIIQEAREIQIESSKEWDDHQDNDNDVDSSTMIPAADTTLKPQVG